MLSILLTWFLIICGWAYNYKNQPDATITCFVGAVVIMALRKRS